MRTAIKETKVFTFDELSEEAKDKAIENLYDINTSNEWYEFTFDDTKEIGRMLGIEIKNIYFSGFSSQGDGACFEGYYSYNPGSVKKIKAYAPQDKELHRIALELQKVQAKAFYRLTANVRHSGHYYHSNCTEIDVVNHDKIGEEEYLYWDTDKAIQELLRDFMNWIYKTLDSQYEWLTSKEQIIETIEANNYEFTEDGKLY